MGCWGALAWRLWTSRTVGVLRRAPRLLDRNLPDNIVLLSTLSAIVVPVGEDSGILQGAGLVGLRRNAKVPIRHDSLRIIGPILQSIPCPLHAARIRHALPRIDPGVLRRRSWQIDIGRLGILLGQVNGLLIGKLYRILFMHRTATYGQLVNVRH